MLKAILVDIMELEEKAVENDQYWYPNGVLMAKALSKEFEVFDDIGNSLGLGTIKCSNGDIGFKNEIGLIGGKLTLSRNFITGIDSVPKKSKKWINYNMV